MIEVNGGIPWKGGGERGTRWLCAWTATRGKRSSQTGLGGGEVGGETPPLPLRRARLVCSPLIQRHEVRKVCIVVMSSLDEISVNYFEICSLASFHSFQVKIQTFSVVAWSFLSWNKAPNCSDITIQKQVLWQTSFVNLLQRLIDYFSFFN